MNHILEHILPWVQKPTRYTGEEYNAVVRDRRAVDVRYALCFPGTYEVGMSDLSTRILCGLMNEVDGVWYEHVFAPWDDMEEEMRREGIPLYGLESGDSIADLDLIDFSLGYEMTYTNVLSTLGLTGLPLRSGERAELSPIVVAGGTYAFNPEPLAPSVGLFVLGGGEDVSMEIARLYRQTREEGWGKEELLTAAAWIPGVYVPFLYEMSHHGDGIVAAITPLGGAPVGVTKYIVQDFDKSYFPAKIIVPSTEIVHDRMTLKVFCGCVRGCRFCQAGYVYWPVRPRDPQWLTQQGIEAYRGSGYQEMTLSSLFTNDYRALERLHGGLLEWCEPNEVSLSLPSLRAGNFSLGLMEWVQHVREPGLTLTSEAGTQRLWDAINKNVTEEEILRSCRATFFGRQSSVKLYLMLGLPTETDEDVLGAAELAEKVYKAWGECTPSSKRGVTITVSTACFIPRPYIAFQWEIQVNMEEYRRRAKLLRDNMWGRSIRYNWHDSGTSFLKAAFSRGGRQVANVIEGAWHQGARFDAWSEYFDSDRWMAAFDVRGLDPAFYANRVWEKDEVLPWPVTSTGMATPFLWWGRERAYQAVITPDCRVQCTGYEAGRPYPGGRCDAET